jgi:XRE family transcriptional regulator, fatty acid utilization regulator
MKKSKLFAGEAIKRARGEAGMSQTDLARALQISPSYLNQIESNQRPLTATLLVELARALRVDVSLFSRDSEDRLQFNLKDALADPAFGGAEFASREIKALVQTAPTIAKALVNLQSAHRALLDRYQSLDSFLDAPGTANFAVKAPNHPYDEVRDYFHTIGNYVESLDVAAEKIGEAIHSNNDDIHEALALRLADQHGVKLVLDRTLIDKKPLRHFDPVKRELILDAHLERPTQAFAMAHQIALLEQSSEIEDIARHAEFESPDAEAVSKVALANYFAGALMLPYRSLLETAERLRYDISAISARFGASFEQVCHRLSTMQRPGMEGIPFYFLRVDRAGNITKRHSATRFQFARHGGACPLWNVHEAFDASDKIKIQIAEMPDGVRYLSLAIGLSKRGATFGSPSRSFAIGLGCEISFADRIVYADGLDLKSSQIVSLIGVSCRVCDRADCPQRAFPPIGRKLVIDPLTRSEIPYRLGK